MNSRNDMYKNALTTFNYLTAVYLTFSSPEIPYNPKQVNTIVLVALKYPEYKGVKIKSRVTFLIDSELYFVKFLLNHNIKSKGDSAVFTYRQIFEGLVDGFVKDLQMYQSLLLNTVNNGHFLIEFYPLLFNIQDILVEALNHETFNGVHIYKKCNCNSTSICTNVIDGVYTYNIAFKLLKNIPIEMVPLNVISLTHYYPMTNALSCKNLFL